MRRRSGRVVFAPIGENPREEGALVTDSINLAGAIVAETAMDMLAVDTVQISPWALREGLILRRMDRLARDATSETVNPKDLVNRR